MQVPDARPRARCGARSLLDGASHTAGNTGTYSHPASAQPLATSAISARCNQSSWPASESLRSFFPASRRSVSRAAQSAYGQTISIHKCSPVLAYVSQTQPLERGQGRYAFLFISSLSSRAPQSILIRALIVPISSLLLSSLLLSPLLLSPLLSVQIVRDRCQK